MDPGILVPKCAEEVFPLVVWSMISNNLDSPSDLLNLSKTCQALADLLKPKRTTFLMLKVFPILYKNGYLQTDDDKEYEEYEEGSDDDDDDDEESDDDDDDDEESDDDGDYEEPEIAEVRKIRLVSRAWKESVDVHFQNHPGHHDIGFENCKAACMYNDGFEPFTFLPYHFDEENISKLEYLVVKTFPPDCSPFITRYVKFSVDMDYPERWLPKRLQTQFKKLLERFGSHIWTCALYFEFDITLTQLYKLVWSYLNLMPNLRSLDLSCVNIKKTGRATCLKQLETLLQKQPFPKLEHLTTLYMTGVPFPLNVGILTRNEQIGKLAVADIKGPVLDSMVNIECLHLEELSLILCSEVDLMQKLTWPLKALDLKIGEGEWATIFAIASTFKSTLEILNMSHLSCGQDNRQLNELRLEIPNLKKLKLEVNFELKTIDFLVGCAALQEIELCIFPSDKKRKTGEEVSLPEDEEAVPIILFEDCFTFMYMSNIWELLPMLQLIKIVKGRKDTVGRTTTLPAVKYRFTRRQHEKCEKILAAIE